MRDLTCLWFPFSPGERPDTPSPLSGVSTGDMVHRCSETYFTHLDAL